MKPVPERSSSEPPRIGARQARGGEIILKPRRSRAIFIGGLVLLGLAAILS